MWLISKAYYMYVEIALISFWLTLSKLPDFYGADSLKKINLISSASFEVKWQSITTNMRHQAHIDAMNTKY